MKYRIPCHLEWDILMAKKTNRMSIVVEDDLKAMHLKYKPEITLWCDGRGEEGRKCKKDDQLRSQEKEDIFKELTERHSDKFDIPKLRLWSRMVASNIHTCSMDEPPKIPIFRTPKKKLDKSLPT